MVQHLAMIMDGNRRWARKQGFKTVYHRKEGVDSVRVAARYCIKNNISYLTLYMLSLENDKNRGSQFLDHIFKLTVQTCRDEADNLRDEGIKVRFTGRRDLFPESILPAIENVEKVTQDADKLQINLMFYYGAQQEIVMAAQKLARLVKQGKISPEDINEQSISDSLFTAGMPEPDLIIRTGGKNTQRLSNFLLFQGAYSELQFKDFYWPELTEEKLDQCMQEHAQVTRNFGS